MPLEKIHRGQDRTWGLWRILETEQELLNGVNVIEEIPQALTNQNKRLEFIAGRVLVKHLMQQSGLTFSGIRKDEFGKPFPSGYDHQLSLSHSFPYVAALLDKNKPAGIDLEQLKPKLLKIAPRVLAPEELADAGSDLIKHCIYWCAKEALIKIHGKKDLVFAEQLRIVPFTRETEGHIVGRIIVSGKETRVPLYYATTPEFVVALNE